MTYLKSVDIDQPTTAFGRLSVAPYTPYIQATAYYDELPANFRTFTGFGGSADASNRMFTVSTGTTAFGYGVVRSFRALPYKPAQGAVAYFTAVFTQGVASSGQIAGLFNIGDGFCFGYNGADFGVLHRYGGLAECRELQITTPASGSENATVTIDSTAYVIPITSGTVQHNAFEIATYLQANAPAWNVEATDDTVQIIYTGDGAKSGTYSFSSTGAAVASWSQVRAGVTKTEGWIAQSSWNVRTTPFDGFDPTLGNVYKIEYQYLGFGAIKFWIENPLDGDFVLVHEIRYANSATIPSVGNPSMKLGIASFSLGSTTNLTVSSASMSAGLQGVPFRIRNARSYLNTKTGVTTSAYTNIFTLRNRQARNGYNNQTEAEPLIISASTDSTKGAKILVLGNATVAGEPNFQEFSEGGLLFQVDTAGTTVTGGRQLFAFEIGGGDSVTINITDLRLRIPPTLRLTFCAQIVSGSASEVSIAFNWYEDV